MASTNAIASALPAIQSEIDAICKDLHLADDHLNHGDLDAMYAGIREAASGQQHRLLALTPDTWAFGIAVSSPKAVQMQSTIVDAEGRRLAPETSLSSVQTMDQMPTSMMMPSTTPAHMPSAAQCAPANKPRTRNNMTSTATPVQQMPMTWAPSRITMNPNLRYMADGLAHPVGVMQHASRLQLSFTCPGLAADCEVVCLATARLHDGDRFLAKSTFFVAFAGATTFSWNFTSVPFNMPVVNPVCHVKLRHVPLSAADIVEKMDRLGELLGQEEYEWRLMALKQEFAVKGISPHPARR